MLQLHSLPLARDDKEEERFHQHPSIILNGVLFHSPKYTARRHSKNAGFCYVSVAWMAERRSEHVVHGRKANEFMMF